MNCGRAWEGLISHLAVLMGLANRPCFAWLIICWLYYCTLSRCPLAVVSVRPVDARAVINHIACADSLLSNTYPSDTNERRKGKRDRKEEGKNESSGAGMREMGEGQNWTREEDRMTLTCGCEALISVVELPRIALLRTPLLKARRSAFHSPLG